jgi:uncharacterized membrane protein
MKKSFVSLFLLTLVAAVGCNRYSPEGPEATSTADTEQSAEPVRTVVNKPIAGEADETFSLSVPFESVALTQGEEKSVLIGINRGENFREEVSIKVSGLPKGVTLETDAPVIKQGTTDATLMLKAAGDAALGDFTVNVTGHTASSAADFTKEFKMTVVQK